MGILRSRNDEEESLFIVKLTDHIYQFTNDLTLSLRDDRISNINISAGITPGMVGLISGRSLSTTWAWIYVKAMVVKFYAKINGVSII